MPAVDQFSDWGAGIADPLTSCQPSTHAAADMDLINVTRCLGVNANGTITVDTLDGQINIPILVFTGWNSIRITKIYKAGSDSGLIVDCWD